MVVPEDPAERAAAPSKVPAARSINPAVPAALDAICLRALSPEPEDRYPTARALADAIDQWLTRRRSVPHIPILGAAAVLFLMGIAALAAAYLSGPAGKFGLDGPARRLVGSTAENSPAPGGPTAAKVPLIARPDAVQLIGNLHTKKYHLSTCQSVKGMSASHRIVLPSPEDAIAQGLKECERCNPPGPRSDPAPAAGTEGGEAGTAPSGR
jgi:hypothetical protein